MSFWGTFVGKAIHRLSGGIIGKDAGGGGGGKPPTSRMQDPQDPCVKDPDYFMNHMSECMQPGGGGGGPVISNPGTPIINPPGGGITPVTPAVPEPDAIYMCGAAVVMIVGWKLWQRRRAKRSTETL